jgi:hypothetical protein
LMTIRLVYTCLQSIPSSSFTGAQNGTSIPTITAPRDME